MTGAFFLAAGNSAIPNPYHPSGKIWYNYKHKGYK
jgi:hypothetical protein